MNKVVNLSNCRDLLSNWDAMRQRIIRGEITAIAACVKDRRGIESITLAGDYNECADSALRASMALSWQLTQQADARVAE